MTLETHYQKFAQFADVPRAAAKMRALAPRVACSGRPNGKRRTDGGMPDGWERRTINSNSASISSGFACSRNHLADGAHLAALVAELNMARGRTGR